MQRYKKAIKILLYPITLVLLELPLSALVSCSSSQMAGSGTEGGNTEITGVILHESNAPAENTIVKLIPEKYNPVIDGNLPDSLVDTTDLSGQYTFTLGDTGYYNIEANSMFQQTRLLVRDILIDRDTVFVPPAILKNPGTIKVFLPDTVDTAKGYVYIQGTTISKDLHDGDYYTGDYYVIAIDSVPSGLMPPVIHASRENMVTPVILSDTVSVVSGDTVIIGTDTIQKPLWRFPLIVGVTATTVNHYNGFDSIKEKIKNQLTIVNNFFNAPDVFNGVFNFYLDSIYEFGTSVEDEFNEPIGSYAMRVIYDQYGLSHLPYWKPSNRVIYEAVNMGNGDDLFNDQTNRNFTWALGLARGCVGYVWLTVPTSGNPINGQPYDGIESIMQSPQKNTNWDTFSIHIINYYENRYSILPEIINEVFPSSMGVSVLSNVGQPLQDVIVDLYGVEWASGVVGDTSVMSGVTDSNGEFEFTTNPFTIGSGVYEVIYGNFLIRAVNNSDTVYTWMPVFEVGNAWFADPDTVYRAEMIFP